MTEQVEILWEKEVLSSCSAPLLQILTKNWFTTHVKCCLRGCDKHCKLMGEQFILNSDDQGKFIQFVGRQSKTYQGGLRQVQQSNENIKHCYTSGKTFIPITFIKSLNIYCTFVCVRGYTDFYRGGGGPRDIHFHKPPSPLNH